MGSEAEPAKSSVRDGGRGVSPRPPELTAENVVGLLRSSGLFVRSEDILAIDRVSGNTYRVIIARNGVAAEVFITKRDGRWYRTPVKLHEIVKIVDAGVKL